jgi:hypothetical protein
MTDEPRKQLLIEKPWVRGVMNGTIFAVALGLINTQGWFGEIRPLTQDSVVEYILAGIVFGVVVYILQFWREQRRMKLEALNRKASEDKDPEA